MFERSDDQDLFVETTRRFLESECPITQLRALAGTKSGFERNFWRRGAELGWTSLLVDEQAGGGSVSGAAVMDLLLVAYEFGRNAAPGPLVPVNLVAAALSRWGSSRQRAGTLAGLLTGELIATWALAEPAPNDAMMCVTAEVKERDHGFALSGSKLPVEAACEADHFLVTARHGGGLATFLLPSDLAGISVTALRSLDLTRRYGRVDFDDVQIPADMCVGESLSAADAVEWLTDLAVVLQLGEMVGAMQWAFDTTLEWTLNRYSFGRPLASYQELKHRMADMKMWLEASYAITAEAAKAVERNSPNRSEMVSAAKNYVGRQGPELMHDCVQLHGGIGVTFDHDLHIFLRRVTVDVPLYGSPVEHAIRVARIVEAREGLG